jgi:hypothetical protein
MMMAYCKNCGSPLKPQDKFCEACGKPVEAEEPAAPVPEAPKTEPVRPNYSSPFVNREASKGRGINIPVIVLSCLLVIALVGGLIGIVNLNGTIGDLRDENAGLLADKSQLTSELSAANNTISGLNSDLNEANSAIDDLTGTLNAANSTISGLNDDLAEANSSLSAANATIADLNDENDELAAANSSLTADLSDANDTILSLNSIVDVMDYNYSVILEFINQRFGLVEEDATQFLTPYDGTVGALVDSLVTPFTNTDWNKAWADYKTMYNWVRYNIEYSYDTPLPILPDDLAAGGELGWFKEFWQYPEETLYLGVGDCEDQALLLASMLLNYVDSDYRVFCIGISNGDTGHMAVCIPVVDEQMAILDPIAGFYTTSVYGMDGIPITNALNQWLNVWSDQIPGAQVTLLFGEDEYYEFDGNADFLQLEWY